jgi:hypothetical protein
VVEAFMAVGQGNDSDAAPDAAHVAATHVRTLLEMGNVAVA